MKETKFKQTEVGLIPSDWEVVRLNDSVMFLDSQRIPIKDSDRKKMTGHYPYYGASGIIDYVDKYIFDDDLILLGEDGANIIDRSSELAFVIHGKCWINNHAHVLKPNEDFNIDYLANYLESLKYDQYNTGTAQPKLNRDKCGIIPIVKPPLEEQKHIAQALSDVDAVISTTEKLIAKEKALKQGAMQTLLSGKMRIQNGKWIKTTNFKQTELGPIPQEWNFIQFGQKATIVRGGSPRPIQNYLTNRTDGINWIKIGDVKLGDKYITTTEEKIIPEGKSRSREVHSGDFILSNSMSFGRPYILKLDGCIHDGWLAIQNYQETFDTDYLYYLLGSDDVFKQYIAMAAGSSVQNLNKEKVSKLQVPLPSKPEQTAIATVLSDMDSEIAALETKLAKYRTLKTGMMQQLLTGKIRLV